MRSEILSGEGTGLITKKKLRDMFCSHDLKSTEGVPKTTKESLTHFSIFIFGKSLRGVQLTIVLLHYESKCMLATNILKLVANWPYSMYYLYNFVDIFYTSTELKP